MDSKQNTAEDLVQLLLKNQASIYSNDQIESQLSEDYFRILPKKEITPAQLAGILFQNSNVRYSHEQFSCKMGLKIINHAPNFRLIALRVTWAGFKLFLNICVEEKISPSHSFPGKSNCKETNIFLLPNAVGREAIKCFSLYQTQRPFQIFAKVLKQYCFAKVGDALGVGPKVATIAGFDIIIYSNCIEFAMEKCQQVNNSFLKDNHYLTQKLKDKLRLLHSLRIVHQDIKPGNIMFSRLRQELVFIDFGFSKLIKEQVGFKSRTKFYGTLHYCSHEMQKAFSDESSEAQVDLYYNDAHCLEVSLQEMVKDLQPQASLDYSQRFEDQIIDTYQYFHNQDSLAGDYVQRNMILRIKFQIFFRDASCVLNNRQYQHILLKHSQQILTFIEEFPFTKSLLNVYEFLLPQSRKKGERDHQTTLANMQAKKEKIFLDLSNIHLSPSNRFLQKLGLNVKAGVIEMSADDQDIILTLKEDDRQSLINEGQASKLGKHQYFHKFVNAIDCRASYTNFQEKRKMASILLSRFKPDGFIASIRSAYSEIETSLKMILKEYLQVPEGFYEHVIPGALTNLIILQGLSLDELMEILEMIRDLKGDEFKMTMMLFRVHLAVDWLKQKTSSVYSQTKIEKLMIQAVFLKLTSFQNTPARPLVNFIRQLILSEVNMKKISLDFCQDLMNYCKDTMEVNDEIYQELVCLTIFERQKNNTNVGLVNQMNTLVSLYQFHSDFFFKEEQISYLHLRIFDSLQLIQNLSLGTFSHIFRKIKRCLQEEQIMATFKLFYSMEGIKALKKTPDELADYFIQLFQQERHRYSPTIIFQCYSIVFETHHSDLSSHSIHKLKTIFNREYLQKMVFPQNNYLNKVPIFFEKATVVIHILYDLYPISHQELEGIDHFFVRLKEYWEKIVCQQCKELCHKPIYEMCLLKGLKQGKIRNTVQFSISELQRLTTSGRKYRSIGEDILMVLKNVTLILFNASKKHRGHFGHEYDDNYEHYYPIIYDMERDQDMFHTLFMYKVGWAMYSFNTSYLLRHKQDFLEYLYFHRKLLAFIFHYPCKQFVRIYNQYLLKFIQEEQTLMNSKVSGILDICLPYAREEDNPYICLLLSPLLQIIEQGKYFDKTALVVCSNVNFVTAETRFIALQHLFNDLLIVKDGVANPREKRNKIIRYFRYLKLSFPFKRFLTFIRYKSIRNAKILSKVLRYKLQQFYQTMRD